VTVIIIYLQLEEQRKNLLCYSITVHEYLAGEIRQAKEIKAYK
jgi:hypothetical protein